METFTKELVSSASAKLFPGNTIKSSTKFLPEQLNLVGHVQIRNYFTAQGTRMSQREISCFFIIFFSEKSEFYFLEPAIDPSSTEFLEAMNNILQKTHNHSKSCVIVKLCRKTKLFEICIANEELVLYLLKRSTDAFSKLTLVLNLE